MCTVSNKNLVGQLGGSHVALSCLQATEALRITAEQLIKFKVMDHVIPEPLGGAHSDPMGAFPAIKKSLMEVYG